MNRKDWLWLAVAAAMAAVSLFLPRTAYAAVIGVAESAQGRIDLFDEPGQCVGRAQRAEWVSPDGRIIIPGCWVLGGPFVLVVFFDADIAKLSRDEIRPPKSS